MAARLLLCVILTVSAVLKFAGDDPSAIMGLAVGRLAAVAEIALVCGLSHPRARRWSYIAVMMLAIGGAVTALAISHPCGCLGPVQMSRRAHLLLCMTIGFMASVGLSGAGTSTKLHGIASKPWQ